MDSWQPNASIEIIKLRAELLFHIREFFKKRSVMEVETPSLSNFPTLDLHLDSFSIKDNQGINTLYLITSPEYHMKRLLAAESGSIYQICKAFRNEEAGQFHNPEFTIIEWYRVGWDHWQLMEETETLLDKLLHCGTATRMSYQEVFEQNLKIDPFSLSTKKFIEQCQKHQAKPPSDLLEQNVNVDEQLNFLMGSFIEPHLGLDRPTFITDYPATQASLARIHPNKKYLAQRFELYYKGLELGNGFHELADAEEQGKRFIAENQRRKQLGKSELPIDTRLLKALEHGLPDCAGIALGFDRILMLAAGKSRMEEVLSFVWDRS
jgi:elongation factor P--(R)-beta-lysine ligase